MEALGDLVEALGDLVEALGDLVEALGDLVEALGDLVELLGDLVEALGDLVLLDDNSRRRLLVDSARRMWAAPVEALAKKRTESKLNFMIVLWIRELD